MTCPFFLELIHTQFVIGGAVRAGKIRPAARSRSSWRAEANRSVAVTTEEKPAEEPEKSQRVTAATCMRSTAKKTTRPQAQRAGRSS